MLLVLDLLDEEVHFLLRLTAGNSQVEFARINHARGLI